MSEIGRMIWRNMVAIGGEEQEACIHCGEVWYRIHYRDGVCHKCQILGRLGRTELARRRYNIQCALFFIGIPVFTFLFLRYFF